MIVVAGKVRIDPTNKAAAITAAIELMEQTRKEPGCISYTFSADLSEPGGFRIFEEWESQAALDAHFSAPHMAEFQSKVAGLGVKEMIVQKYDVSSVGPVR